MARWLQEIMVALDGMDERQFHHYLPVVILQQSFEHFLDWALCFSQPGFFIPCFDRNLALTGSMVGAFFLLHVAGIKAPYGRYSGGAGKAWGPLVPARVSWVVVGLHPGGAA